MFDKSAGSADINKKVKESCVLTVLNNIYNIGHIHKTNFAQSEFSMSYLQKTHFLRNWEFTFFWKYLVCGFKIEISEYPTKVLYVTYSPYKYELHRTKTHEIRAKYFRAFFKEHLCAQSTMIPEKAHCDHFTWISSIQRIFKRFFICKQIWTHCTH